MLTTRKQRRKPLPTKMTTIEYLVPAMLVTLLIWVFG